MLLLVAQCCLACSLPMEHTKAWHCNGCDCQAQCILGMWKFSENASKLAV